MPNELPLRDIHLPEPLSWWPPAPGWWLLGLLLLLTPALLWLWRRRLRVRRAALARLGAIESELAAGADPHTLAMALSTLLRRVVLTYRPRADVAALTGAAWRAELDALAGPRGRLSEQVAQQLSTAPYNPRAPFDAAAAVAEVRRWLRALPPQKRAA